MNNSIKLRNSSFFSLLFFITIITFSMGNNYNSPSHRYPPLQPYPQPQQQQQQPHQQQFLQPEHQPQCHQQVQNKGQQRNAIVRQYAALQELQDHLDDLQSDGASMEIVFTSLKNAFLIYPTVEEEEVDKEICRAYDDLMAQVRQLDRSLKRLDKSIKSTLGTTTESSLWQIVHSWKWTLYTITTFPPPPPPPLVKLLL